MSDLTLENVEIKYNQKIYFNKLREQLAKDLSKIPFKAEEREEKEATIKNEFEILLNVAVSKTKNLETTGRAIKNISVALPKGFRKHAADWLTENDDEEEGTIRLLPKNITKTFIKDSVDFVNNTDKFGAELAEEKLSRSYFF